MTEQEGQLQILITLAKRRGLWPDEIKNNLSYLIRKMQEQIKSSDPDARV